MIELTVNDREALDAAIDCIANDRKSIPIACVDRLLVLRDACPERPALEDGIYEVTDENGDYRLRYVRDGRFASHRLSDGTLYGGYSLPDDTSTWRRIDGPFTVTPEQIEAAAQAAAGCSEFTWSQLFEKTKDYYRDYARRVLTAAGVGYR